MASVCQKGVAPDEAMVWNARPMSPDTGVLRRSSVTCVATAVTSMNPKGVGCDMVALLTERLRVDLEAGHLDDVRPQESLSSAGAVLD